MRRVVPWKYGILMVRARTTLNLAFFQATEFSRSMVSLPCRPG